MEKSEILSILKNATPEQVGKILVVAKELNLHTIEEDLKQLIFLTKG
ncbi:hypothetical protein [Paenibacillus polymyxa]|nr:hypothetical protein [Paenibacillus polymyxa]MCJ1220357.1 hypothetical protein [Paenibacillus polymyxa]